MWHGPALLEPVSNPAPGMTIGTPTAIVRLDGIVEVCKCDGWKKHFPGLIVNVLDARIPFTGSDEHGQIWHTPRK